MSLGDADHGEMHLYRRRLRAELLDDPTAERLLRGQVDPDDAPPGYAGVAGVLRAAAAEPVVTDSSAEDQAVGGVGAPPTGIRGGGGFLGCRWGGAGRHGLLGGGPGGGGLRRHRLGPRCRPGPAQTEVCRAKHVEAQQGRCGGRKPGTGAQRWPERGGGAPRRRPGCRSRRTGDDGHLGSGPEHQRRGPSRHPRRPRRRSGRAVPGVRHRSHHHGDRRGQRRRDLDPGQPGSEPSRNPAGCSRRRSA